MSQLTGRRMTCTEENRSTSGEKRWREKVEKWFHLALDDRKTVDVNLQSMFHDVLQQLPTRVGIPSS